MDYLAFFFGLFIGLYAGCAFGWVWGFSVCGRIYQPKGKGDAQ
jgi:hypothetical protein